MKVCDVQLGYPQGNKSCDAMSASMYSSEWQYGHRVGAEVRLA
jgi:hypothetical protein